MITCQFENGGKASLRHVVVHCIIEKDGELLLGKRAGDILETGKWALISGFLNRDETAAACAVRELREETGYQGEVVSLFRINTGPNRPHEDRQNIAIEFIVRVTEKVGSQDQENSKVEWIPIDKLLPFSEFAFDHGETIRLYLEYRKSSFILPILV